MKTKKNGKIKLSHKDVEKQRRGRMKCCLEALKQLNPQTKNHKLQNLQILESTIRYIQENESVWGSQFNIDNFDKSPYASLNLDDIINDETEHDFDEFEGNEIDYENSVEMGYIASPTTSDKENAVMQVGSGTEKEIMTKREEQEEKSSNGSSGSYLMSIRHLVHADDGVGVSR